MTTDSRPIGKPWAHVMLDLETLGKRAGCSILSIGAVCFGPTGLGPEFYAVVSRKSCREIGLHEDPSTIAWWNTQSEEAREVLLQADSISATPVGDVLINFTGFLKDHTIPSRRVWGNGADFDLPILSQVYVSARSRAPWRFVDSRCFRTLKNVFADIKPPDRLGTHHHALDDAKYQALHAVTIMRAMMRTNAVSQ